MPTGKLVSTSTVPRYILQYAQELFQWLYREYSRPDEYQLDFWAWAMGLGREQLVNPQTPGAKRLLATSADWPWRRLQRWTRQRVERLIKGPLEGKPVAFPVAPRILSVGEVHGKGKVLRWGPSLPRKSDPKAWVWYFVDEQLNELNGAGVGVLGLCPVCGHFFIRVIFGRGKYCSPRCRNQALHAGKVRERSKGHAYRRESKGKQAHHGSVGKAT